MSQPTMQEIIKSQGTRLQDLPPWLTYAASMDEKVDPKLEEEIKRYSERRHEKSSAQNEEELARWKEDNDALSRQYQWLTPEEYEDHAARIGKIMHSSELINKLRKCGLKCWYRQHPQPGRITLVVKRDYFDPEVGCWVQEGYCPEYSIMNFDEHGVPLAERYRGWRTPLLQLILKGLITEETVKRVFGEATGPASERYNSTLYNFRNNWLKVAE